MSQKSVAIVQSNYVPWKGYFDLINKVSDFVLLDCVQYTKRDWRNRNLIRTPQGLHWLTIPVDTKGKYEQTIRETKISDRDWARTHWLSLKHNYAHAPHFRELQDTVERMYQEAGAFEYLSQVNEHFLRGICALLGISTRIVRSEELPVSGEKTERLLKLCKALNATTYLSGPAAKSYLEENRFTAEGIAVEWMAYDGYPEYPQTVAPFEHGVSVLDLLFNVGAEAAPSYMKSFGATLRKAG